MGVTRKLPAGGRRGFDLRCGDLLEGASASEWAVWIATGVLCSGAYARHGLVLAMGYWMCTALLCVVDPTLHWLQLLNLGAVVYDLSFELHRMYLLVSSRPLLIGAVLCVAMVAEWALERYEEQDARDDAPSRSPVAVAAKFSRSLVRQLMPALMGVLLAGIGWLMAAAFLSPSTFAVPLLEQFGELSTAMQYTQCSSISDCLLVTGSNHQTRVHGVYVRTPRTCAGKPVYKHRSGNGLYLHSPGHENQWNVGPELCVNAPRNKWMELYSSAPRAEDIGNATWFEFKPHFGWRKNSRVRIDRCVGETYDVDARACVSIRGSAHDDAVYKQVDYVDARLGKPGCNGNRKPVYLSPRVASRDGAESYLYSPTRRNSWLIGSDPCRSNGCRPLLLLLLRAGRCCDRGGALSRIPSPRVAGGSRSARRRSAPSSSRRARPGRGKSTTARAGSARRRCARCPTAPPTWASACT